VNTASVGGLLGGSNAGAYVASKHGVVPLGRTWVSSVTGAERRLPPLVAAVKELEPRLGGRVREEELGAATSTFVPSERQRVEPDTRYRSKHLVPLRVAEKQADRFRLRLEDRGRRPGNGLV
jgi:hypothetical protein